MPNVDRPIPTAADRFANACWILGCGFGLGFACCAYWLERFQPQPFLRNIVYTMVLPGTLVVFALPRAILEIARLLRNHAELEARLPNKLPLRAPGFNAEATPDDRVVE